MAILSGSLKKMPMFRCGLAGLAVTLFAAAPALRAQNADVSKNGKALPRPSAVSGKAAQMVPAPSGTKKSAHDKTKTDAAELSALANQLRDELSKMNVNVLSLDVLQKTDEIEKLAKKIQGEGNGK